MDFLKETFLESPYLVYLAAGLAELITAAIYHQTRAYRARVMLLVWPLVAVSVGALAHFVVTDREEVRAAWSDIAAAVETSDVPRLMRSVAPDFSGDGLDRGRLERLALEAARAIKPGEVAVSEFTVGAVMPQQATATIVATYKPYPRATHWELGFVKQADGAWRLSTVKCTQPDDLNLRSAVTQLQQLKSF